MIRRILSLALAACAGAALALGAAPSSAAPLTPAQQTCVNTQNGGLAKMAATISGELLACVSDYSKGKQGVSDVTACLAADRKGKIAKARGKLAAAFTAKCTGNDRNGVARNPGVLVTDDATVAQAASAKEQSLFADLFGAGANGSILTEAADQDAARCQVAVAKHVKLCQDTKVKEFVKCAKTALAGGAATSAALEACVLADPKGKIAKACDDAVKPDPIRKDLARKCGGSTLANAFAHCPTASVDGVHDCLETPVECIACKAINQSVSLQADCDLLDDGQANQSCGCGDGFLDPGEQCDGASLAGATCESLGFAGGGTLACSSSCAFDTSSCTECNLTPNTCPGYLQPNDNVTCIAGGSCTFACQGEHYDVNNDPSDGCEVTDSPTGNHTLASGASAGPESACDDGTSHTILTGTQVSDRRTHQTPSVAGYDLASGSAPDFFDLQTTSGTFCLNDVVLTLSVASSANPGCYKLTVITDTFLTYTCQTNAAGTCSINHNSGGQFSDGATLNIEVQKTCGASLIESVAYTVAGHL